MLTQVAGYQRVGSYMGPVSLEELAARVTRFALTWVPSDYDVTQDAAAVAAAFHADLEQDIPGEWAGAMLVVIRPGGTIRFHKDLQPEGIERLHVVLQTNRHCWNYHGGVWQQLELGGVYSIDATVEHASINLGETARVHLVVDVLR